MPEKFDVIVVGAGVGGLSAAYKLAQEGLSVAVIERGDYPGAKNVMGGVFYRAMMDDLIPEFWREAPLQRPVVEQRFWLMDDQSVVTSGYKTQEWAREPYNCFTVFRGQFDQWFAGKCIEAGVLVINETVVEACIVENERVVGIRTGRPEGELYANVVVLADGVNSLLSKQLGFHAEWMPQQVALAVMEELQLPAGVIEERFNLDPGLGATIEIYGSATLGLVGTAFIYTNKEHISIGVGALLSQIREMKVRPYELLEALKKHPMVAPLVKGGKPVEYYAHLIPEGGYNSIPKLVGNGVVVVGDAAQLVNGIHREGSNLAMTSGRLAAEAIIQAHNTGEFTVRELSHYEDNLRNSFVIQDLKKYKNISHLLETNPRFLNEYIPATNMALHEMLTVDGVSKRKKQNLIIKHILKNSNLYALGKDIYKVWRAVK
ncbi:Electron-transferring-flavoproteindehydrogenase [Desulfofarcimen acetoxidans DSM 771]|uniref:Electron-transferring-flavoproteindehydrogenase n=1 Tax=Desulfofarcimen acetoxidans (strain ATCC 49208 / DSM 771 / KCTC 5769 / VKM B-1644 / 5575) TaxID=485916 RepID=C8VY94_DESAS|nr:FAD-dependent oxidoreductase [Desulfofarcimen acetoxidans]ACV62775.1 Electron-transferring-flavoproteindehydrogenase [Desulfofarcimen acetoxidans DSM 771]